MSRVALAAALLLVGCSPARPRGSPEGWPGTDWIVDGRTGVKAEFSTLIDDLATADVVFVGEDHDNPHHHHVQARIAEALLDRKPDLALGMEMLQEKYQAAADRFVSGAIDLETFAAESEWKRTWGFPISLYRPVLEVARARRAPIIALNAAEETVRRLSKVGLEGLSPEERAKLPELDLENEDHERLVRNAFEQHHAMPEERFRRFYAVQVLWDETMAERTVEVVRNGGGPMRPMMVIAGTGHLVRRLGIPSRVERRIPDARTRVVLAMSATTRRDPELRRAIDAKDADWYWVTPER